MTDDDTTRPAPSPEEVPTTAAPAAAAPSTADSAPPAQEPALEPAPEPEPEPDGAAERAECGPALEPRTRGRAADAVARRPIASALTIAITAGILGLSGGYLAGISIDERGRGPAAAEQQDARSPRPGGDARGHRERESGERGARGRGTEDATTESDSSGT